MSIARHASLFLLLILLPACDRAGAAGSDAETWGFVATLGNDTTSVERITRDGNRLVSVAIGRSPHVVRREWEATLAPDGTVQSWSMDTYIPNAPAAESRLHHELVITDSLFRTVRQTGADSTNRTYARSYTRAVPWNAYVYATWELLLQAARGLPDTTRIGQYFFEGWAEGNFGFARVRPLDANQFAISSTGLAGTGVATTDEQGRLIAYSGEGTTYKQQVQRVTDVPDIEAIFERFTAAERAAGGIVRSLSVRDTMNATVAGANLHVEYSRPFARGRTLVGGLIPYDQVWRTGANAATHFTTDAPLSIAGIPLDSGTYTLWTLPTRDGVQLIVNAQTGQWGTGYRSQHDVGRAAMQTETIDTPVEQFTIRVDTAGSALLMEWGTFRWSAPLEAGR